MAHFFKDKKPVGSHIIRFGRTDGNTPEFPVKALYGRYDAHHNIIVKRDLRVISLEGQDGYCWEYADDVKFFSASFMI